MTKIPNYETTKAEAERLADELADLQKQEGIHVQALLALADQNPDVPLAPIVVHRLSRHHDPKQPAIPGWARIVPPDVADAEVLRLMQAQRAQGMAVAEQATLVLASGDPSAAVHEQQRREAPWREAVAENARKEAERELALQKARAWEWAEKVRQASESTSRGDQEAARRIDEDARRNAQERRAYEDSLIARFHEAQGQLGGAL